MCGSSTSLAIPFLPDPHCPDLWGRIYPQWRSTYNDFEFFRSPVILGMHWIYVFMIAYNYYLEIEKETIANGLMSKSNEKNYMYLFIDNIFYIDIYGYCYEYLR